MGKATFESTSTKKPETDHMEPTQFQNVLILVAIAGFALMEFASRRYQATVHATANDTKLELFMFVRHWCNMVCTVARDVGRLAVVGHVRCVAAGR
jgi:hypothetical protein